MKKSIFATALVTMLVAAESALALPIATLTFRDPTGTVGPTDSIPVFVTLALDPTSAALQTDSLGNVTSGIAPSDLPAGFTVSSSGVSTFFRCSGTFTTGCGPPPYDFQFAFGPGGLVQPTNLDLQPGTTHDFLFGTFMPNPSPAPAGTYVFFNAGVFIFATDETGTEPLGFGFPELTIAETCPSEVLSCAFTRTVLSEGGVPVPEPSSLALLGSGLLAAGLAAWRRARRR